MDKEEYKRQNETRDKKKNADSFRERWFGWWKTPSDRFAALIALFTGVLALVAYFQLSAMRSTDEGTRIAADAAKKSADVAERTLLDLQRPYIFVDDPQFLRSPIQNPHSFDPAEVGYKFRNYGPTPGIIRWIRAEATVSDPKTGMPTVQTGWIERFNGRAVLKGGEEQSVEPTFHADITFPKDARDAETVLTIEVTYDDVFDYTHVSEFTFIFFRDRNGGLGRFVGAAGKENNRHKDKKFLASEKWKPEWSHDWTTKDLAIAPQ